MVQYFDCEQGSAAWFEARRGIPTASCFSDIMSKGRGSAPSKTRLTYMHKLAGEIITGEPMESVSTAAMERGHALEPEARELYQMLTGNAVQQVGFARNGRVGASPDGLVGDIGGLEIKTKAPHLMVEVILADLFPAAHWAQCQGILWVTEREWIDLAVYCPGFPLFIKRADRDEAYIEELSENVGFFLAELDEAVAKIRALAEAA